MQIDRDKSGRHDLRNVVALLGSDKGDAGFRYFTWESRSKPDLAWARDVVAELMSAVTPVVESTWDKAKSGVPVKMDIVCEWMIPCAAPAAKRFQQTKGQPARALGIALHRIARSMPGKSFLGS